MSDTNQFQDAIQTINVRVDDLLRVLRGLDYSQNSKEDNHKIFYQMGFMIGILNGLLYKLKEMQDLVIQSLDEPKAYKTKEKEK